MENELKVPTEHAHDYYFHSTFDDPFESALSSMVSSPTSNGGGFIPGDGMMIRELFGRLGSMCDSGEISPQSCIATANNTPLNSPPKFNLSSLSLITHTSTNIPNHPPSLAFFNGDPGFAERAAKFSSFGISTRSGNNLQNGKLTRLNSQLDWNSGVSEKKFGAENAEMVDSREASSVSEQNPVGEIGCIKDANSRKRKSISKAKVKDSPSSAKYDKAEAEAKKNEGSPNAKRSKTDEDEAKKENAEESNNSSKDNNNNNINNSNSNSNSNNSNSKETGNPEPAKDYIHVRAKRGQATDSHSLAERVRREKISARMKFLQDLVPGCNKVTGKAAVLDEIINYVQSLQCQVEFLSMKLATVNPRMDFNIEALLSKDMFQCRGSALPQTMYPLGETSIQAFPYETEEASFSVNPLNATTGTVRNSPLQLPSIPGLTNPMTQMPTFWEDDLQILVQMGIAQNQTQTGSGTLSNAQMKVEL